MNNQPVFHCLETGAIGTFVRKVSYDKSQGLVQVEFRKFGWTITDKIHKEIIKEEDLKFIFPDETDTYGVEPQYVYAVRNNSGSSKHLNKIIGKPEELQNELESVKKELESMTVKYNMKDLELKKLMGEKNKQKALEEENKKNHGVNPNAPWIGGGYNRPSPAPFNPGFDDD